MDTTSTVLDDLRRRGLIAQTTDEAALAAALADGPVSFYCGFDPSAPSLHMGNLVQLLTMRRLQNAGHRPYVLVGGATGLIGDPRMSGERVLNTKETVAEWVDKIRIQAEKFVDFTGDNPATLVNNLDWTAQLSAIDFLRDVGKNFRMGRMLAKENVSARLNSDDGLSFTEFSYQVLQGMDYLELYRRYGITLQTGGNDQWGNLTSGTDLVRRVEGAAVHALTTPLLTKADGTKFGKTESGTVWLDADLTSPYAFYQFWLNADDRDVMKFVRVFSFRDHDAIAELAEATAEAPHRRAAQRALADDITALVHGEEVRDQVRDASAAIFGSGDLRGLGEDILDGVVREVPHAGGRPGDPLVDLFVATGIVKSKSEARRAVHDGGAYVNNIKVADAEQTLRAEDLLHGRFALLRRGKKTVAATDADHIA